MKLLVATALGICLALPAVAADMDVGRAYDSRPVVFPADVGCVSFNTFTAPDADIGIGFNANGAPGGDPEVIGCGDVCDAAGLVGMSAPVAGCADGFLACLVQIFSDCFNDVGGSDIAHQWLWNDTGSGPADACGSELIHLDCVPVLNCDPDNVPGNIADERFVGDAGVFASSALTYHVGATYETLTWFNLPGGSGTDWSIAQETGHPTNNLGYINLTGAVGAWDDQFGVLGIDRANGQGYRVTPTPPVAGDCEGGATPVESSSWGAIKASFDQ